MKSLISHQPKGLPFLFLTELWERFGFYIVQGMLVLYTTEYFGYSDSESYTILGIFTALAYISPLGGGILTNKMLGFKTAIVWGGLFLLVGYAMLALPNSKLFLYPALATIIVGTGLFKPNISSLLGLQYRKDDPRRDAGFTLFYIGINVGAFLAGVSGGYMREYLGWHFSFGLASLGLLIGLMTFLYGLKYIHTGEENIRVKKQIHFKLFFYCILAILGLNFLLKVEVLANWLLPAMGVVLLMFLVFLTGQQNAEYRKKMFILNSLIISSIIFWMLYLQIFSSGNLFVDRLVNKDVLGFHFTSTLFWGSVNFFIILLGPIFAAVWHALAHSQRNPSPVTKFWLGILFAGFGFLLLAISTYFPNDQGLINPLWVFCAYFLITIGELFLSPIGLSAVTTLAPDHLIGFMMGVWFVALGFGGYFSGLIAQFANVPDNVILQADKLSIYSQAFFNYAYIAFFVAIALFFAQLFLGRAMRIKIRVDINDNP